MKTKVCRKCKIEKDAKEFFKDNTQKDSLNSQCKQCIKIYREENSDSIKKNEKECRKRNKENIKNRSKKYYEENKETVLNKNKIWRENNKDSIRIQKREYRKNNYDKIAEKKRTYQEQNTEKILKYQKEYYKKNFNNIAEKSRIKYMENKEYIKVYNKEYRNENSSRINEQRSEYRNENKEVIKERDTKYKTSFARYETYKSQLTIDEDPKEDKNGDLLCRCTHCKEYFLPTNREVHNRAQVIKGSAKKGENRLYCSDKCKQECDIYNAKNTPKSLRNAAKQARCNQPVNRQALLDLQIDEFGYNFCDKCGTEKQQSELIIHHNLMVSKYINEADNMSHQLITCEDCHDHKGC